MPSTISDERSKNALDFDPRYSVSVVYDADGIGHLDHRNAAIAWDEYNSIRPITTRETVKPNVG